MKKIISVITVIAVMLSGLIFAQAENGNDPQFSLTSREETVGNMVYVPLRINNNPGITAFKLTVDYSSEDLELVDITYCNLFSNEITLINQAKDPLTVSWFSTSSADEAENGIIAVFEFRVLPGAQSSDIILEYDESDIFNSSFEIIDFDVVNATITILEEESTTFEEPSGDEASTNEELTGDEASTEETTTLVQPTEEETSREEPTIPEQTSATDSTTEVNVQGGGGVSDDEPVEEVAKFYLSGDVDLDGSISSADARLTLRAAVNLEHLSGFMFVIADADGDGVITAADARKILRCAVSLEKFEEKEISREKLLKPLLCSGYWYSFYYQAAGYDEYIFNTDGSYEIYSVYSADIAEGKHIPTKVLSEKGTYSIKDGRIKLATSNTEYYYVDKGDYCRDDGFFHEIENNYVHTKLIHYYDKIDAQKFFEVVNNGDGNYVVNGVYYWQNPADFDIPRYDMTFAE